MVCTAYLELCSYRVSGVFSASMSRRVASEQDTYKCATRLKHVLIAGSDARRLRYAPVGVLVPNAQEYASVTLPINDMVQKLDDVLVQCTNIIYNIQTTVSLLYSDVIAYTECFESHYIQIPIMTNRDTNIGTLHVVCDIKKAACRDGALDISGKAALNSGSLKSLGLPLNSVKSMHTITLPPSCDKVASMAEPLTQRECDVRQYVFKMEHAYKSKLDDAGGAEANAMAEANASFFVDMLRIVQTVVHNAVKEACHKLHTADGGSSGTSKRARGS